MLLLHLVEHREGRPQAHLLGVAGVDAGDDGLGDLGQRLASEAPAHEVAERLVADRLAAGQHQVHPHPQLATPAYEAAECERHQPGRHHEDQALGQFVQSAPREDPAAPHRFVRIQQAVPDAQLAGQLHRPRLVGDERVRTALDHEAVVGALGQDLAAQTVVGLEQHPVDRRPVATRLLELPGGSESGHAAADDDDAGPPVHGCPPTMAMRTGRIIPWRRSRRSRARAGRRGTR